MSSVTFSPSVGGDGSTVTDDSSATTGLDGGGHRTRFVPALAQVVAVAANTVAKASEAAASATAAAGSASSAADQVGLTTAAGAAQVALAAAHVATASAQATASATSAGEAATSASQASASATSAATSATSAGAAGTAAAQVLISAVTQRPALRPSLSVDWTLKPTAAALTAAGWTVSRAGEMTYFGAVPVKVAENLFTQSADFASTVWGKSGLAALSAVTDESGLSGFNLIAVATSGYHAINKLAGSQNLGSQTYRIRFLLKAATYTKAIIGDGSGARAAACFDLSAGTLLNTGSGATAALPGGMPGSAGGANYISSSITPHELGGGLYWCELVTTSPTAGISWTPTIVGYPDSGATLDRYGAQYTGDGTSGIEIYAAQLQHNFDGEYVPTTDTAITRYESPLLTAAANELAYQHNSRGECAGLLQYPADTNLILQSENLDHASWGKSSVSATTTKRLWAGSAPFWRIAKTTTGTGANLFQDVSFTALSVATPYTVTVALLADQWSATSSARLSIYSNTGGTTPAGQIVVISGPGTVVGSNVVSGLSTTTPTLVRYTATLPIGTASIRTQIFPDEASSTTIGAAILATRGHLSASPRYVPYIPTTTAAVTRGAQSITLGGSAFAAVNNPVEGTLLARASVEDLVFDSSKILLQTQHGADVTSGQRAVINASSAATPDSRFELVVAGTNQGQLFVGSMGMTPKTLAISYALNAVQAASAGALSSVDTSSNVPSVDRLVVGTGDTVFFRGLLQRTELYPRAMTSAELAAITTPGVLV